MPERFRGSSDIPLAGDGMEDTRQMALRLAQKGGLDRLYTSDLTRARQTAALISQFTHAPIVHSGSELHPWHLGQLEGQEVTPERVDFLNQLVRHAPDQVLYGRGPQSVADGESFNQFTGRVLPFIDQRLRESMADPSLRLGMVTHYRNKKLVDAWIRGGGYGDYNVDPEEMTQKGEDPGHISRLNYDTQSGLRLSEVDMKSPNRLSGGVYLIRHGRTPWNEESDDTN